MLVLAGCVQSVVTPLTNAAAARVLDRLGIDLVTVPGAGCCGAVAYHLNAQAEGLEAMRRNIDAWWPEIQAGCEAILVTASGCGVMVKDYGELLREDPAYAEKAARISALARDPAELLASLDLSALGEPGLGRRIAFHPPCTLQHGQKVVGVTESILTRLGFALTPVPDAHLCCGSAGTYSITQPALSGAASGQQGRGPGVRRARADRHRQYRLSAPPGGGHGAAGGALAGVVGWMSGE